MAYEIPSEAYIGFLDQVIEIHWDNHAVLMFGLWFVLVPTKMVMRWTLDLKYIVSIPEYFFNI